MLRLLHDQYRASGVVGLDDGVVAASIGEAVRMLPGGDVEDITQVSRLDLARQQSSWYTRYV